MSYEKKIYSCSNPPSIRTLVAIFLKLDLGQIDECDGEPQKN